MATESSESHHALGDQLRTKPKQQAKVAVWNIRTMYETGRTAQVVREMTKNTINILGIEKR